MFVREPEVESHTYVHMSNEAEIHIVRHKEDEEDAFSVRFGDEDLVLEFDEGFLSRLIQALQDKAG